MRDDQDELAALRRDCRDRGQAARRAERIDALARIHLPVSGVVSLYIDLYRVNGICRPLHRVRGVFRALHSVNGVF